MLWSYASESSDIDGAIVAYQFRIQGHSDCGPLRLAQLPESSTRVFRDLALFVWCLFGAFWYASMNFGKLYRMNFITDSLGFLSITP